MGSEIVFCSSCGRSSTRYIVQEVEQEEGHLSEISEIMAKELYVVPHTITNYTEEVWSCEFCKEAIAGVSVTDVYYSGFMERLTIRVDILSQSQDGQYSGLRKMLDNDEVPF